MLCLSECVYIVCWKGNFYKGKIGCSESVSKVYCVSGIECEEIEKCFYDYVCYYGN